MKVFKFGGASVKNAEAVKNVGEVLKNFKGEEVLVVVSAMGKSTNSLELLAKAFYEQKEERHTIYKEIKAFHDEIIKGLLIDSLSHTYDDIENLFIELECELESVPDENYDKVYDQVVSYGEIFSSRILSAYLNESNIKNRWMDAQNFINYRQYL
jgi:aspartate kinase